MMHGPLQNSLHCSLPDTRRWLLPKHVQYGNESVRWSQTVDRWGGVLLAQFSAIGGEHQRRVAVGRGWKPE